MEYKLIKDSLNDAAQIKETVFNNRGIRDVKIFCNLQDDAIHDFRLLDNIGAAVECYLKHLDKHSNIHIICDCDTDGNTSAAMIYKYTELIAPKCKLTYSIHNAKQHGLSDDITIPADTDLLIMPDAGSNDVEQCKILKSKGIDIIILDHHEIEISNEHAIVVNSQMNGYPNKQLSGAGVTYKFLQAVDEETWNNYADSFIDLVALGLIADNMDVRIPETRLLIDRGLNKIRNKLFKALIDKQSYSLGGSLTGIDVQFYIAPLINGLIRAGDSEEKELLFRAFIETDEVFEYKKRGEKETAPENVYDRVARLCVNAKKRQNTAKDKSLSSIYEGIEEKGHDKNKIIFANVTGLLDETLTGVTAIKVAEHYNKPCLLLRKTKEDENIYGGSGRNIDNSPVENFKDFLNELGVFISVQGHQGAFGIRIHKNNIPKAITLINEKLKDVDFTKYINADFILPAECLDIGLIKSIDELREYYGAGFKEPMIVIEDLVINKSQFTLMGKDNNTWKITTDEGVALVKFRIREDDELIGMFEEHNEAVITIAGTVNINSYKGILMSQLIVTDYELREVS